jgi:hypothetical protein
VSLLTWDQLELWVAIFILAAMLWQVGAYFFGPVVQGTMSALWAYAVPTDWVGAIGTGLIDGLTGGLFGGGG